MSKIIELEVESDEIIGQDGGFLGIRRMRLRNRRADGSLSEPYACDFVERPYGLDAVVVALYRRTGAGVDVLLRQGLRPTLVFGRTADRVPVPDPRTSLLLTELVAGIVEAHDKGLEGIRRRAAEEALEEAGYAIEPERITFLGAATFPTPGLMAEKFWLMAAEVVGSVPTKAMGDGSPMEEGSSTWWTALDEAIAACVRGEIEDCKTELTLRRLADWLRAPQS